MYTELLSLEGLPKGDLREEYNNEFYKLFVVSFFIIRNTINIWVK